MPFQNYVFQLSDLNPIGEIIFLQEHFHLAAARIKRSNNDESINFLQTWSANVALKDRTFFRRPLVPVFCPSIGCVGTVLIWNKTIIKFRQNALRYKHAHTLIHHLYNVAVKMDLQFLGASNSCRMRTWCGGRLNRNRQNWWSILERKVGEKRNGVKERDRFKG